jgi:hypothetical protein
MATEAGLVPWAESGMTTVSSLPALRLEVGAHQQQAAQLALRARRGLQRHVRQADDGPEVALQAVQQLEGPLRAVVLLQRVQRREAGQRRRLLVDLRVVLHRARTRAGRTACRSSS